MLKAIFITVRTGSTRLPNKSTLQIKNKHTIEYVIDNVKKSKHADKIILCTTNLEKDEILCDIAVKNNIEYFCGDEMNKLKRWYGACRKFNVDFFVTVDGDDLFYDAGLADLVFEQMDESDIISGQGLYNDTYGIKISTLESALVLLRGKIVEPHDLEHFGDKKLFKIKKLKNVPEIYKKKNIRMTLDYKEDFLFFSEIINNIKLDLNIENILYYIHNNPDVNNINYFRELDWKKNQNRSIIE
jgi:spore coat polysaccharide biosynthesis protein SpsF (cytidylyltransferase family)